MMTIQVMCRYNLKVRHQIYNLIQLAGTGHYDGTAGKITNNATNTTATSSDDLELSVGTSGSVIIELRKDENFTA